MEIASWQSQRALVHFRTGPMTDRIKCCWCMHSTMVHVRLCALFRRASARCETALAPLKLN